MIVNKQEKTIYELVLRDLLFLLVETWLKGIIYAFIDFLSSSNNAVKNFLCSSTTVFFVFAIVKGLFT